MINLNSVFIAGNLTKDVDLRSTPQGSPVATFTIAVNQKSGNRDSASFFSVVAWGKTAENCKRYIGKGSLVLVEGCLKQETWEDRNGGGRREKVSIIAGNVQFLPSSKTGNQVPSMNQGVSPEYGPDIPEPTEHQTAKANGYQPQPESVPMPEYPQNCTDSSQISEDIPF